MSDDATPAKVRLTDGLGPLPHVPPPPFAVFDEFGRRADNRVHAYAIAYATAAVAIEQKRWESAIGAEMPADFKDWHQNAAILRAQADASPSESLAELLARANTPTPVGYMHPEDFRDVAHGGWVHTVISGKRDSPHMVPLYASPQAAEPVAYLVSLPSGEYSGNTLYFTAPSDPRGFPVYRHPPAAPRQQPEAGLCRTDGRCQYAIDHDAEGLGHCPAGKCAMPEAAQAAEPGELPPLPTPLVQNYPSGKWSYHATQMGAYARLALATSPLPSERVERVMEAVDEALHLQQRVSKGTANLDYVHAARGSIRAILEGRA